MVPVVLCLRFGAGEAPHAAVARAEFRQAPVTLGLLALAHEALSRVPAASEDRGHLLDCLDAVAEHQHLRSQCIPNVPKWQLHSSHLHTDTVRW